MNKQKPYSSLLLISVNGVKVKELAKLSSQKIELTERATFLLKSEIVSFRFGFFRNKVSINTKEGQFLFKTNRALITWLDPFVRLKRFFSIGFAIVCLFPLLYFGFSKVNAILVFFSVLTWLLFSALIRSTNLLNLARRIFWAFFLLLIPALPFFPPIGLLFLILLFIFYIYLTQREISNSSRYLFLALAWLQVCLVFLAAFPLYYEFSYSFLYSGNAKTKCLESNKILGKVFSVDNQLIRLKHRSARLHYQPVRYQIKRASGEPIFLSCGPSNEKWMSSVMHWQPYSFKGDKNLVQMDLYSSFELQRRSYITGIILVPGSELFFSFKFSEQDSIDFLLELVNQSVRMTEVHNE